MGSSNAVCPGLRTNYCRLHRKPDFELFKNSVSRLCDLLEAKPESSLLQGTPKRTLPLQSIGRQPVRAASRTYGHPQIFRWSQPARHSQNFTEWIEQILKADLFAFSMRPRYISVPISLLFSGVLSRFTFSLGGPMRLPGFDVVVSLPFHFHTIISALTFNRQFGNPVHMLLM